MNGEIERIREALQFIDASDRETWLRMGMAIKSELADAGFDLWEAWSLQAESFNGKDARDVWKSIRAGGKATIGTLFYEAKANGWRDDGGGHQMPTPEELVERRRIATERALIEGAEIARERTDTAAKAKTIWDAFVAAMSRDDSVKCLPWQKVHDLGEQCLASVHGSFQAKARNSDGVPLPISNRRQAPIVVLVWFRLVRLRIKGLEDFSLSPFLLPFTISANACLHCSTPDLRDPDFARG